MSPVLLATGNAGKVRELVGLLGDKVDVLTPRDINIELDVEEDGETFAANACKKAEAYCQASGLLCIADDSGLCVDALGGAPGVHSARYAADAQQGSGDLANRRLLLQNMAQVADENRAAHFQCALAVAAVNTKTEVFTGRCDGVIAREPRGESGFGYDPLFEQPDGRTFAEMSMAEKQHVSHRGRALQAAAPYVLKLAARIAEK